MGKREVFKNFSLKGLLLTIFKAVVVTTFIGFTILFIYSIPNFMMSGILFDIDKQEIIETFNGQEGQYEALQKGVTEMKSEYGENYPAGELIIIAMVQRFASENVIQVYLWTLISGVILGTIVYIVWVQEAKGMDLFFEMFMAFVIIVVGIVLINFICNFAYNKILNYHHIAETNIYVYDIETTEAMANYVCSYIGVFVLVYVVNVIKQKRLANKLNKELNNGKNQFEN